MTNGWEGEGEREVENSIKFKKHPPIKRMLDVFAYIISCEFHSAFMM